MEWLHLQRSCSSPRHSLAKLGTTGVSPMRTRALGQIVHSTVTSGARRHRQHRRTPHRHPQRRGPRCSRRALAIRKTCAHAATSAFRRRLSRRRRLHSHPHRLRLRIPHLPSTTIVPGGRAIATSCPPRICISGAAAIAIRLHRHRRRHPCHRSDTGHPTGPYRCRRRRRCR